MITKNIPKLKYGERVRLLNNLFSQLFTPETNHLLYIFIKSEAKEKNTEKPQNL